MEKYKEYPYERRAVTVSINAPLAMAYVPIQKFTDLYTAAEGYRIGTIFRELDLPWKGGQGK